MRDEASIPSILFGDIINGLYHLMPPHVYPIGRLEIAASLPPGNVNFLMLGSKPLPFLWRDELEDTRLVALALLWAALHLLRGKIGPALPERARQIQGTVGGIRAVRNGTNPVLAKSPIT
jgi:hypothetical protein